VLVGAITLSAVCAPTPLKRALALNQKGDYANAIKTLEGYLPDHPSYAGYLGLKWAYMGQYGQESEFELAWTKALAKADSSIRTVFAQQELAEALDCCWAVGICDSSMAEQLVACTFAFDSSELTRKAIADTAVTLLASWERAEYTLDSGGVQFFEVIGARLGASQGSRVATALGSYPRRP